MLLTILIAGLVVGLLVFKFRGDHALTAPVMLLTILFAWPFRAELFDRAVESLPAAEQTSTAVGKNKDAQ